MLFRSTGITQQQRKSKMSTETYIDTEEKRAHRQAQIREQEQKEAEEAEKAKKNRNFVQVYPDGWKRLNQLITDYPIGARLYIFLAQHIDPSCGAVVASQQLLAEELNVSERYIRQVTKKLEEMKAILRIRIGTGMYAYALNPDEIWRSFDTSKKYATFKTKTLARKSDNGQINRKIRLMQNTKKNQDQSDLFKEEK